MIFGYARVSTDDQILVYKLMHLLIMELINYFKKK